MRSVTRARKKERSKKKEGVFFFDTASTQSQHTRLTAESYLDSSKAGVHRLPHNSPTFVRPNREQTKRKGGEDRFSFRPQKQKAVTRRCRRPCALVCLTAQNTQEDATHHRRRVTRNGRGGDRRCLGKKKASGGGKEKSRPRGVREKKEKKTALHVSLVTRAGKRKKDGRRKTIA